jgi:type I restriction enzyme S subunit
MVAIGDISHLVTKGTTPTTMGKPFTDQGIRFIKAEALNGDTYLSQSGMVFIDEETHQLLKRSIIHVDDVLITIAGAQIGRCGYVTEEYLPANTNQAVGIVRIDRTKALPRFVYYYFKLPDTFQAIQSIGGGQAAQPNLNLANLKQIKLRLPSVSTQQRVVSVLSAYDDLIENNRRRMALLEESARLLYREWFVRLRFPGHEHTRITDGVPEGWDKGYVSDFYDTSSGGTPSRKKQEYFTGEIPWVKTQELSNGFITQADENITEMALANSSAKLFPERTVLIALYGATVGELGILAMPAATNQACCAVMPKDMRAYYGHAFLFLRESKNQLVSLSAGAAQKNISQQIVRSVAMVMPNRALMSIFVDLIAPVFDQLLNLERQSQKLRTARDLLLPRLMSGELAA